MGNGAYNAHHFRGRSRGREVQEGRFQKRRKKFLKRCWQEVMALYNARRLWGNSGAFRRSEMVDNCLFNRKLKKIIKRCWQEVGAIYNVRPLERSRFFAKTFFNREDKTICVGTYVDDVIHLSIEWPTPWKTIRSIRTKCNSSWWFIESRYLEDFGLRKTLNWRVWSWLRLNAGGMLNTCKSNGSTRKLAFLVASGGRVSNT